MKKIGDIMKKVMNTFTLICVIFASNAPVAYAAEKKMTYSEAQDLTARFNRAYKQLASLPLLRGDDERKIAQGKIILRDQGININTPNPMDLDVTILIKAVKEGNANLIRLALALGADTGKKDGAKFSAIEYAENRWGKNHPITKLILGSKEEEGEGGFEEIGGEEEEQGKKEMTTEEFLLGILGSRIGVILEYIPTLESSYNELILLSNDKKSQLQNYWDKQNKIYKGIADMISDYNDIIATANKAGVSFNNLAILKGYQIEINRLKEKIGDAIKGKSDQVTIIINAGTEQQKLDETKPTDYDLKKQALQEKINNANRMIQQSLDKQIDTRIKEFIDLVNRIITEAKPEA